MDQYFVFKLSGTKHGIKRSNTSSAGNEYGRDGVVQKFSPGFCNPNGIPFSEVTQPGSKVPLLNHIVQDPYFILIFATANTVQAARSVLFNANPDHLAGLETEITSEPNQENIFCNFF